MAMYNTDESIRAFAHSSFQVWYNLSFFLKVIRQTLNPSNPDLKNALSKIAIAVIIICIFYNLFIEEQLL